MFITFEEVRVRSISQYVARDPTELAFPANAEIIVFQKSDGIM